MKHILKLKDGLFKERFKVHFIYFIFFSNEISISLICCSFFTISYYSVLLISVNVVAIFRENYYTLKFHFFNVKSLDIVITCFLKPRKFRKVVTLSHIFYLLICFCSSERICSKRTTRHVYLGHCYSIMSSDL